MALVKEGWIAMNDVQMIVIPYVDPETGTAEVFFRRYVTQAHPHVNLLRAALADICGLSLGDTETIRAYCQRRHVGRVYVLADDMPFGSNAYLIDRVLASSD